MTFENTVTVNYTRSDTQVTRCSSTVKRDELELASKALYSFYDDLYSYEKCVPTTVTVDDMTFTVEEIEAYREFKARKA